MKSKVDKTLQYYMSLNYLFTVEQYDEDGEVRFGIQIPDLPGVWASGKTIQEACNELDETKKLWFKTCLKENIDIPEPVSASDFSGKFILRLDSRLHMSLSKKAKENGISLNQYVRIHLEKQIVYSELLAEIKKLSQTIAQQDETLKELKNELKSKTTSPQIASVQGWSGLYALTKGTHVSTVESYSSPTMSLEDWPYETVTIACRNRI